MGGICRWRKEDIIIYPSLHCHHQNDFRIKMGSDESHFYVSLIVRDKVTRQYHNFRRERRAEADSNWGPTAYQPNALPTGQTDSPPPRPPAGRLVSPVFNDLLWGESWPCSSASSKGYAACSKRTWVTNSFFFFFHGLQPITIYIYVCMCVSLVFSKYYDVIIMVVCMYVNCQCVCVRVALCVCVWGGGGGCHNAWMPMCMWMF